MRKYKWIIMLIFTLLNMAVYANKPEPAIYTEDKLSILVTKDQPEFTIRLKANPTTGFNWFLREYDNKLITPLKHHYEAPKTDLIGAPGYDVWTFAVKPSGFTVPQVTQLRFIYTRPWEVNGQGKILVFRISTE